MTSAAIRSVYSPDVDEVWTARPLADVADPFVLELEIGPDDRDDRDLFAVLVGTRRALEVVKGESKRLAIEDIPAPVEDTAGVVRFLHDRVADCVSEDWEALRHRLQSFLDWEYDDYRGEV